MNLPPGLYLSDPPLVPVGETEGVYVHVGNKVHNTVAFLGYADTSAPGGMRCEGTGFFVAHGETAYLVTARHVAEILDGGPFNVRVNRRSGEAEPLHVDVRWAFHPDNLVDLVDRV